MNSKLWIYTMQNCAASLLIASPVPVNRAFWNRCFKEAVDSFGVVVLERVQAIQGVHFRKIILPNTDQRQKHFL
jgi:hypothetical protein